LVLIDVFTYLITRMILDNEWLNQLTREELLDLADRLITSLDCRKFSATQEILDEYQNKYEY
jgi:hypothetical protein